MTKDDLAALLARLDEIEARANAKGDEVPAGEIVPKISAGAGKSMS